MGYLLPPRVELVWSASGIGSTFAGYRLYRRQVRTPAQPWVLIAEPGKAAVAAGQSPSNVEAQWRRFVDYEAGWAASVAGTSAGQWAAGWDYRVTAVSSQTGLETSSQAIDVLNVVAGDGHPWICSNLHPWLNHPVPRMKLADVSDDDTLTRYRIAGRDLGATRQRAELPGRSYRLGWDEFGGGPLFDPTSLAPKAFAAEDAVRYWRAAAAAGVPVALHRPLGDRVIGALSAITSLSDREAMIALDAAARLEETSRDLSGIGDYNLPCGLVLNGSTQYLTTPDSAALDPSASAFTVFCCAVFAGSAGSDYAVSKGNGAGAGDGYFLRTTGVANEFQFRVDGASAAVNVTDTSPVWFDGNVHVAVATSTGTAQALYRDGATTPVATGSTTHGAVSNAVALVAGADNAGASGHMACAPLIAWGLMLGALTPTQVQALSYYLLGYPGWRVLNVAAQSIGTAFYDLRDSRAWPGTGTSVKDLAGSTLTGAGVAATTVASPIPVGAPWPLKLLERF